MLALVPQPLFSAECSNQSKNTPPRKIPNKDKRQREYLLAHEVDQLRKAVMKDNRYAVRDSTIILLMFRHALRSAELVSLKWSQIDLKAAIIHVTRRKKGLASSHPLTGEELRALRMLRRANPISPYVFITMRGAPLTTRTVRAMIAKAGEQSGLGFPVSSHQLRHSCGYKLVNDNQNLRSIQLYMGHASISNTTIYAQLNANKFKNFFSD